MLMQYLTVSTYFKDHFVYRNECLAGAQQGINEGRGLINKKEDTKHLQRECIL